MKSYKFTLCLMTILLALAAVLYYTEDDGFDNAVGRVLQMTDQGQVQYFEGIANGTDKISVQAPASLSASSTITLPATAGSAGQFLQTDGSGNLTYANSSASTLDSAYDNGQSITADVGPLAITTSTNNQLLSLNQSAGNSANVLQIANSGSGNSINVASGAVNFAGNATIGGNLSLTGNVATALAAASTLTVTGATTLNSDVTVGGSSKLLFQADTNLYRTAAAVLQTDHSIRIKGGDPWFDIMAFGATNNGTTDDDTQEIQAALDAAETNGGIVFIPRGTFYVNQGRLEYLSLKGVTIQGTGWESKLLWAAATDTPATNKGMINIHGTGDANADHCTRVVVRDIAMDFGGSRAEAHVENKRGLNIYNSDNIEVTGCYFEGCLHEALGTGNFGDPATPGIRAYIAGNYFFDGSQDAINPNVFSAVIIGNFIRQHDTGIEAGRDQLVVIGNEFVDIEGSAIKISSVESFVCNDNRIYSSPTLNAGFIQGAIYVVGGGGSDTSNYGQISGNQIFNSTNVTNQVGIATGLGTSTEPPAYIHISNNIINGATRGIYINQGEYLTINSNHVQSNASASANGIELANPTPADVNFNIITNNYCEGWDSNNYAALPAGGTSNFMYNNHTDAGMVDLQIAGGTKITKYLSATATYDAPNLVALEDVTSTTVTVTGAATSDLCTATLSTIGTNNVGLTAVVSATDTVRVVIENKHGANLDLASGTLRVGVFKH